MTVREDLVKELKACILSSHDIEDTRRDCDVARFLRDHGPALLAMVRDAERYRHLRDQMGMEGFWLAHGKFGEGCSRWHGEAADRAIDQARVSNPD